MKQKLPLKQLYTASISFSIVAGFLIFGWIIIQIYSFFNSFHPLLLAIDLLIAVATICVIFSFCQINIWVMNYFHGKYNGGKKEKRLEWFWSFLLSLIPMIIGIVFLRYVLSFVADDVRAMNPEISRGEPRDPDNYLVIIFVLLIIGFVLNYIVRLMLNFIVVNIAKQNLELENAQLRIKNIEATYQQLRMQIHPHFLFNSLSTLKMLIGENPDSAKLFLKRLSDFLRASIEFNNSNLIEVNKELKLCIDYLQLQQARFGDALRFTVDIPEGIKTDFIPLFSIQQLLENAIKHNILRDDLPLMIKIEYNDGWITISNNKQIKKATEKSTGAGLTNLVERYKLLSRDEPVIKSDENQFSVSIKVLNNEDSNYRR